MRRNRFQQSKCDWCEYHLTELVFHRIFFVTMALQGKASDASIDHDPVVSEVHTKDRKSTRPRSAKWVAIPVVNKEALAASPKKKK